ncbi:hypothetical protein HAZT_HAZT010081 [Hyalella azteca]|uniref:RING-type E3 ubiquitin transferase n=1 Tax=Hyalella azteca TaxID=294128 RepID=A0A6A0GYN8_HYAAZ|nr:hypothetical protein HAZT_HAZT010081 [Hyalella azteca]
MTFLSRTAAALLWLSWVIVPHVKAEVVVVDRILNKTNDVMADMASIFGPELSFIGLKGLLVKAHPPDACQAIKGPPIFPDNISPAYAHWVVLIHRRNCTFAEKVQNAQNAGFAAVIVMNIGSDDIEPMNASDKDAENITIPSVFIGQSDGDTLELLFLNYRRFGVIISADLPDIESYLLPFAITVAVCFVGMLLCMIVKCVRDYRRSMRHRLSWRALRRLPLHKFKAGVDTYDMCAICLDDYLDGDKLRILPCNHAYHSRCIDPWLTKRRRVCPVCKQKVRTAGEPLDDSDDEDLDHVTERAPLLQQATQVSSGTFANNRENPFARATRLARENNPRRHQRYGRLSDDDVSEDGVVAVSSDSSRRASADIATVHGAADGYVHSSADSDINASADGHVYASDAEAAMAAAAMQPAADECLDDQLKVVSVTRSRSF